MAYRQQRQLSNTPNPEQFDCDKTASAMHVKLTRATATAMASWTIAFQTALPTTTTEKAPEECGNNGLVINEFGYRIRL